MKKKGFFFQIFVNGGILIEGSGPLGHPPGYAYDFEIRSRPLFLSLKKHLKQN